MISCRLWQTEVSAIREIWLKDQQAWQAEYQALCVPRGCQAAQGISCSAFISLLDVAQCSDSERTYCASDLTLVLLRDELLPKQAEATAVRQPSRRAGAPKRLGKGGKARRPR